MRTYKERNPGWFKMQELNSQQVPIDAKPHAKCKRCGKPIYFFQIETKKYGLKWYLFEEVGCGGGGMKALQRHKCEDS